MIPPPEPSSPVFPAAMRLRPVCLLALIGLASCAGYRLNGAKPAVLADIETISVPMFRNDTLHPRAEAIATSAVADAFILDGTYRIGDRADADAVLVGTVRKIEYSQLRSTRLDTLRPEELQNNVVLEWRLVDPADPARALATGNSVGTSRFFVDANLQTARNNALPDAMQRVGDALVSRLANGY